MIRIQNLTLARGAKPLFEAADLVLNPREKVGLIGANGSGKSTLFSLLRGELHADGGEVDLPASWRIAHVAQETPALQRSALDYAIDGDTALRKLERGLADAEARHDGIRIGELHAALHDADAYTARARAETLLNGLGFSHDQMKEPVASFSGGWRMRLNLAQALMCPSELLLLDEPTNHLDLDAVLWLEQWLEKYPGTLLLISHDREFLDLLCTHTVHLHEGRARLYAGNYTAFERQRAEQLRQQQISFEREQVERAHLQAFIDRFKAKASKAKQAQSRMKRLAKLSGTEAVRAEREIRIGFAEPVKMPNTLLRLTDVDAGYVDPAGAATRILHAVRFGLEAGDRIGLLGPNGAGKSTLVRTLVGELQPLAGERLAHPDLQLGYFAQHTVESLHAGMSPIDHLKELPFKPRIVAVAQLAADPPKLIDQADQRRPPLLQQHLAENVLQIVDVLLHGAKKGRFCRDGFGSFVPGRFGHEAKSNSLLAWNQGIPRHFPASGRRWRLLTVQSRDDKRRFPC